MACSSIVDEGHVLMLGEKGLSRLGMFTRMNALDYRKEAIALLLNSEKPHDRNEGHSK